MPREESRNWGRTNDGESDGESPEVGSLCRPRRLEGYDLVGIKYETDGSDTSKTH